MSFEFHKRLLAGLSLAVLTCGTAWAEPGDGLRAGSLKVSPGLTVSGVFDSNVFFQSPDETEALSSAPSVRISPFLTMETVTPRLAHVTLDARMGWQQYLSGKTEISEQSGLSASLGGEVGLNRDGAFSVTFRERFVRTNETPNVPSAAAFNRDVNSIGLTLGLHPGDQVFQHYLTYAFLIFHHENVELEALDRNVHHFTLANNWRFLPRTALNLTVDYQLINYDQLVVTDQIVTNDSSPLRITGGLSGSLTNRIAVKLVGGWGWGFYDAGVSASDFLLDSRVSWKFGDTAAQNSLFLGYSQGFGEASISNYYSYYKPYAGYSQRLAERMTLKADLAMQLRSYPGTEYDDTLFSAAIGTTFDVTKWWSFGANYSFLANMTDDRVQITTFGDEALREYSKHVVSLSTTIHY